MTKGWLDVAYEPNLADSYVVSRCLIRVYTSKSITHACVAEDMS